MFDNVLVGVDGRQGGRDAIALAKTLGSSGAGLTLAHVYGGHSAAGRLSALAMPFELEAAEELVAHAASEVGGQPQTAVVYESAVGRGLHELAEHRGADLLVVGSSRHALLGRVLMGDDARTALNGAPSALAIAPRGYAQAAHGLRSAGVGYDGSPQSINALCVARELAARNGATLHALWVVSLQNVREERPIPADWPQEIDHLVEQCTRELQERVGVTGVAAYGGPREELARFGQKLDLLIVGSRGYGPIGRLFHGSVSAYLVSHAACPLLVLPRSPNSDGDTSAGDQEARTRVATGS